MYRNPTALKFFKCPVGQLLISSIYHILTNFRLGQPKDRWSVAPFHFMSSWNVTVTEEVLEESRARENFLICIQNGFIVFKDRSKKTLRPVTALGKARLKLRACVRMVQFISFSRCISHINMHKYIRVRLKILKMKIQGLQKLMQVRRSCQSNSTHAVYLIYP